MEAFLDSSVLIAAFYEDHVHHDASFRVFHQQTKVAGCTAAHCLVETYAVVTGMTGKNRASPDDALLFLNAVCDRLTMVTLDGGEFVDVLSTASTEGIIGGTTYDALIGRCALKADAKVLYTWNTKHFKRIGGQVAARLREP
jgi:predicted nucleic acid-binding protein